MMAAKLLISMCLLGTRVRYDGTGAAEVLDLIATWRDEGRLVTVCPEVAGGLPVPRPPAEIVGGTGEDVLEGRASVLTRSGEDVSAAFEAGARAALELVEKHGIRVAVLKERSPSCSAFQIHDGTYSGTLRAGNGVTGALLKRHGVAVFGESELAEADAMLRQLDG